MLNKKLTRTLLACLMAIVLMLSLFTVSVFAEEADDADAAVTTEAAEDAAETTGTADDEHNHDDEEEKEGLVLGDIIMLSLLGVAIIAVVIYCLTHKEKVGKWARGLRSEFKKISWSPWTQVRKNTIVVLIVVLVVGLFIAIIDLIFQRGILAISSIF